MTISDCLYLTEHQSCISHDVVDWSHLLMRKIRLYSLLIQLIAYLSLCINGLRYIFYIDLVIFIGGRKHINLAEKLLVSNKMRGINFFRIFVRLKNVKNRDELKIILQVLEDFVVEFILLYQMAITLYNLSLFYFQQANFLKLKLMNFSSFHFFYIFNKLFESDLLWVEFIQFSS